MAIGIDFGTTNSVLACADMRGVRIQHFPSSKGPVTNFNSVIFFPEDEQVSEKTAAVGPAALEAYLDHDACGRLLQSLKSFLTSSFESTRIGSKRFTLEEFISFIVRGLVQGLPEESDLNAKPIVIGRPVRFVNANSDEDNKRAEERLRRAVGLAGLTNIYFEYEPVGAAFSYENGLEKDELLLVGDFGGGTSDFTLMKVGPTARKSPAAERMLGTSGVGVAGDAFDASIVRNKVVSHFGRGAYYETRSGQKLEIPHWFYSHVSNWYQLAMLKEPKTLKLLYDISLLTSGKARQGVEWLMTLIEENLSYHLYQSVADTKARLSDLTSTELCFVRQPINIQELIDRNSFESWIVEPLVEIRDCVDEVLSQAGVKAEKIDRIFLTGGSAFVPAVRKLFVERFGKEKIAGGNEFTSVAGGLALKAHALEN